MPRTEIIAPFLFIYFYFYFFFLFSNGAHTKKTNLVATAMANEPWLDDLSDDWDSLPETPQINTISESSRHPPLSNSRSRPSSEANTPSRIPVPSRSPFKQQQRPQSQEKRGVLQPRHFIEKRKTSAKKVQGTRAEHRTPPIPTSSQAFRKRRQQKGQQTPTGSSTRHSPAEKPSPTKNQEYMETARPPLRAVSNVSAQSSEEPNSTVQVRPNEKLRRDVSMPEWQRRLIRGETPGNHRDLFAPIGLENIFKPPSPGLETCEHEAIRVPKPNTSQWSESNLRSASGLEDLRNEGITPIYISVASGSGQDSTAAADPSSHVSNDAHDASVFDSTTHSLPRDLSMGTSGFEARADNHHSLDYDGHNENQMMTRTSTFRSSPPPYYYRGESSPVQRPTSSHTRVSTSGSSHARNAKKQQFGSPLKLFGNHDTFTNNRLLRRMSQFEASLSGEDDDEQQPPYSPSEEVRRRGRRGNFRRSTSGRPRSSSSAAGSAKNNSHVKGALGINRFGGGQLDDYGFSDTSAYDQAESPRQHYENSFNQMVSAEERARRHSLPRRSLRHAMTASISVSGKRSQSEQWGSLRSGSRVLQPSVDEYFNYPDGKRIPKSPAKYHVPKKRRTRMQPEGHDPHMRHDPSVLPRQVDEDVSVSLLRQSLMHHGQAYSDGSTQSPRPLSKTSPRGKTLDLLGAVGAENSTQRQGVPELKVTGANDEARKGSITTQDFINEATRVMEHIRAHGKSPASGLASVEESGLESKNYEDNGAEESTLEEFSRPPSREGVLVSKEKDANVPSARIMSHLMKFQEDDDLELAINGSVTSLRLNHDHDNSQLVQTEDDNTRKNAELARKRGHSVTDAHEPATVNSPTFARSVPTGSSQDSQTKGLLPSGVVSCLIPEQVNGLTYDRSKNQWIKGQEGRPRPSIDKPETDDSEDDPFKNISDLSIDESEELRAVQVSSSPARRKYKRRASPRLPNAEVAQQGKSRSTDGSSLQSLQSRSTTRPMNPDTAVKSWSSNDLEARGHLENVEHEIELCEGRLSQPPHSESGSSEQKQPRAVTVCFSSPSVFRVGPSSTDSGPFQVDVHQSPNREESSVVRSDVAVKGQDESSVVERRRLPSEDYDGALATRDNNALACLREERDAQVMMSCGFELSSLSDFPVGQADRLTHAESSYVEHRTHPTGIRRVHGRSALSTELLLKHITDALQREPDWDNARRLDLRCKCLNNLHKLDFFCPALEELNVSENGIENLNGVPDGLRTLTIRWNSLSSSTAWSHLVNLQYLDVSGNDLEDLHMFRGLLHLRELKAMNNRIRDIDGISRLNGLLSLDLRGNALSALHFENSEL